LSARNLNLLAIPQLDTQPAVDIVFGGFDPAEVDDLGAVRPKKCCRAKSLLDGCERTKDEWGIATKMEARVIGPQTIRGSHAVAMELLWSLPILWWSSHFPNGATAS
jgi:hypothetical protein